MNASWSTGIESAIAPVLMQQAPAATQAGVEVKGLASDKPNLSKEEVPGGPLMIAAYAVMWAIFFGFLVLVWRRHGALAREVRRLELKLDERIGDVLASEDRTGKGSTR